MGAALQDSRSVVRSMDDGTENWSSRPRGVRPRAAPRAAAARQAGLVAPPGARRWIETGTRNVLREDERPAWSTSLPWLVEATPDGNRYVRPRSRTRRERWTRIRSPTEACGRWRPSQRARRELEAARPKDGWPDFEVRFPTASGEIVLAAGAKRVDIPGARAPFLVVHLQGPLTWTGPVAGARPDQPLSVALVMGGPFHLLPGPGPAPEATPASSPAAPACSAAGSSTSPARTTTVTRRVRGRFGAALLGMGVLVDEGGDDTYSVRNVGEGAALFGAGLLLDAAGNDRYDLLEGDGQGFGGPGGIGILADRSGDDVYVAEPLPEKAGTSRADYHSDQKIVGSNAQGAGMGRRGDVSDGHAWAGGLGALLDVDGNDTYSAGNFSQGVGYWFGTGILYDGGGDDTYDSVYFSHASGAHFAVGIVDDEGGNDVHRLSDFPKVGPRPQGGRGPRVRLGRRQRDPVRAGGQRPLRERHHQRGLLERAQPLVAPRRGGRRHVRRARGRARVRRDRRDADVRDAAPHGPVRVPPAADRVPARPRGDRPLSAASRGGRRPGPRRRRRRRQVVGARRAPRTRRGTQRREGPRRRAAVASASSTLGPDGSLRPLRRRPRRPHRRRPRHPLPRSSRRATPGTTGRSGAPGTPCSGASAPSTADGRGASACARGGSRSRAGTAP